MHKTVFLDTNVYLHYEPFDQIPWLKTLAASEVTIIVPPIVVRELNKHKDTSANTHLRRKASSILTRLYSLFKTENAVQVRDCVKVCLEDRDPPDDIYTAPDLNRSIQDDQLIASIIQFREENPGVDVVLVTADSGLLLMGKAKRHGIQVAELPDNTRLPEEPDKDAIRIRELKEEIRRLQARIPRLSLSFLNGNQHETFQLKSPLEMTNAEADQELKSIKLQYPKIGQEPTRSAELPGQLGAFVRTIADMNASLGASLSHQDIETYNQELETFYGEYAAYILRRTQFENLRRRTLVLAIRVTNRGTAPAEDVDVKLCFPDGLDVIDGEAYPSIPKLPDPPSGPKTRMQRLTESLNMPLPPNLELIQPGFTVDPNVSLPTIRKVESHQVEFNVTQVKHKSSEEAHPLYVVFES